MGWGGSTITQQLAKNYTSPPKKPPAQAQGIFLALRLDDELTKNRILHLYLNVIEFGPGISEWRRPRAITSARVSDN
jgi:monofunctional biosynthetic peptidoglycan transglycosylase